MTRGSSTSCLSTLIRASLPRSLLRLRRHSVDGSSLPAAFAVRLASNAAFCPSTPRVCCATHLYASPTLMYYILHPFFPGRDHSRSPSTPEHMCTPRTPLTVDAYVSGPDRRPPGFYETMLGCISTCSLRAFQRSHSRVRQPPSRLSGFESGVQNQVRPPVLTATLYPDRGTAEPSCTPLRVPRAAQAPVHRMPHSPSPGGASSPPRARAYPCATLLPSRGRCTRYRSGPATSGVL